ncbi:carbohydrate esterase family 16 protein [Armillaria fumosa]|nr:carbohydrate esterase family 16 protein [Armillaria fumosa]
MYLLALFPVLSLLHTPILASAPFKSLVTFGDSYTDTVLTGDGGTAWPVYAASYANLSLHPYARSGATCSNAITPMPWASIMEYELPLYFLETHNGSVVLDPKETLYTEWIGTNDLGVDSIFTGSNDGSVVDVVGCMVDWVRMLYADGARYFMVQNMIPLDLTVLYSPNWYPNQISTLPHNATEWSIFMRQLVLSGNALVRIELQALAGSGELPDAHIGLFDSHGLFQDMYQNPGAYLNGTAPLNVTVPIRLCVYEEDGALECTVAEGTDKDSFLWQDELHPSEQANRVVAREIALVATGEGSDWATWFN